MSRVNLNPSTIVAYEKMCFSKWSKMKYVANEIMNTIM